MMEASEILEVVQVAATILIGVAGLYFANSFRRRSQVELANARRQAYATLWEITGLAAPTRLSQGRSGVLSTDERRTLYAKLTTWYYQEGQGMLLSGPTRQLYIDAKYNLTCRDGQLRPSGAALLSSMPHELTPDEKRGCLSIRQLSLLRTQMKADLAVYGQPFSGKLREHEREFLRAAGIRLWRRPWREAARRAPQPETCCD